MENTKHQADILTRYLVGRPVQSQTLYSLYEKSLANSSQSNTESKLVNFSFSHPRFIPFIDAGLVFLRPTSEMRRRIYIVFSVLESTPEYADFFLPKKHTIVDFLIVFGTGIRAVFRAIIGIIIIKVARL